MLEYHLTAGGEKHWSTNYSGIGEKGPVKTYLKCQ